MINSSTVEIKIKIFFVSHTIQLFLYHGLKRLTKNKISKNYVHLMQKHF